MTVFAKRRMSVSEWAPLQHKLQSLQTALGGPHDLMMFSAQTDTVALQDIFIVLPDYRILPEFLDFIEINRADLPDFLTTLVVREDRFEERFPDIAAKRRSRIARR